MTTPRAWTTEDDATLRDLHGQGVALHSISKEMKRAKQTVSDHAKALGLSFDRGGTVEATAAAKVDAKARRTALTLAMLSDLEEARKRLGASESAREFQAAAQGMDALMRSYVNLARLEPDDGGLGEAQGIVGRILAAITLSTVDVPRLNPTAPRVEVASK